MMLTPCGAGHSECMSWAQPSSDRISAYAQWNISLESAAVFFTIYYAAASLVFWMVGYLIYHYRSDQWFALLVAHFMVLLGTGGVSLVFFSGLEFMPIPDFLKLLVEAVVMPTYQVLSIFFLTFPNGKLYGRWNVIPFFLICLNTLVWIIPSQTLNIAFWSETVSSAWLLLVYGSHLVVQVIRYRRMYTTAERQQTKWLIYGFSIPIMIFIVGMIVESTIRADKIHPLIDGTLVVFIYLPVGLAIGIAILLYHLWDIDVVISRTLVYTVLTVILVAVYALIVSGLSWLLRDDRNFLVSLFGAGVIAVIFQPLREIIKRTINRLMFGQRDEPLTLMSELGNSLEAIVSPDAALQYMVETTARSLKLPFAAVEYGDHSEVISFGKRAGTPERFPLVYHAQIIGYLLAVPRSRAETLHAADRLVLENIARQASNILHASHLAEDLQRSRQQIVTTREEERRRLRRDLHDGLGPALAILTLQAEAALEWLRTNPEKSEALLEEILNGSQRTLVDIRRIVYELRPPALDDLGLVPAIREQATQYTNNDLLIIVEAPEILPALPAAVEVATYRIVQEALTNVTRHARAHTCKVCLSVNGKMDIEITDDGIGIPVPRRAGVGLNSIHERAAELGGSCVIESKPGQGTQIKVSLPRL